MHKNPGWCERGYENETDLQKMLDLLAEGRAQTDDWHYPHAGDLLFGFFMVACHLDPQKHIRLWEAEGRLVGYAVLGEDPSYDWQVLPAYEWCGIEEAALAWAERRVGELRRSDPKMWGGKMVTGARQDNDKRRSFLEQNGFRQGGAFSEVNMICRLDQALPEVRVREGWQVRGMGKADDCRRREACSRVEACRRVEISQRAEAQRSVWQPWTVGNVSDDDYTYFMSLPGYERSLDVVAVSREGVVGAYVNGWVDTANRVGDFGPVGTQMAFRRQGLGRAVLLECLRRMQRGGMERVSVSTGMSNTAATGLYESVGFTIVNQYLEYVQA